MSTVLDKINGLALIFISIIFVATSSSASAAGQEQALNIIYTGAMNGKLEPCGCSPKTDFGGLPRIAGFISADRESLSPYIVVDAGNFSSEDTPQGRLKVETMLKSFLFIKYDAVALSRNESLFPEVFFSSLLKGRKIPFVSESTRHNNSVSIRRDGLDINISADPRSFKKEKLNILLTDRPVAECRLIKGWDIIITSSGEILDEPVKYNETVIAAAYPEAEKIGILSLQINDKGKVRSFRQRLKPLGNDIEEDAGIRDIINDYDSKVAGLLRKSEKPPSGTSYLGAARCAECHQPFEKSWKNTRHANAFSSLQETGKSADPECILCHTVGFGEEGGFYSIETTPELANVQCEECHGLDRKHVEDFSRPMRPVTEAVCLKCHTGENSPDFDFKVYLKKIMH